MDARIMVNEVLVDTVVADVPVILTLQLQYRVMCSAVYFLFWQLLDNAVVLFVNLNIA